MQNSHGTRRDGAQFLGKYIGGTLFVHVLELYLYLCMMSEYWEGNGSGTKYMFNI
jgi:hypothetical protein